ncbi:MAG: VCBS repeat-containing protein, partial [Verrucomicrobiota bacterium]
MAKKPILIPGILTFFFGGQLAAETLIHFDKQVLNTRFFSEGACFADIDSDGHQDIVSGPLWYSGPEFRKAHAFAEPLPFAIKQYSEFFFTFTHDFNRDGRPDVLGIPMPGAAAHWYENPGRTGVLWKKHLAFDGVDNE